MNSEKQVKDLTAEELVNITKEKEESVSYKLRNLLDCKVNKEKQIVNLQEDLVKTNAKITELESLTVEDAYDLIQKEATPSSSGWCLVSGMHSMGMTYTG